ncbi:unnamed protein product [Ilex paraguariensis]|uniref:Stress-associated endoplasmic reticulum protein n=1 Tax=Ilex paraguariensis TaxID=185542 RepID=A0ABC8QX14_9AQUA
MRANAMRREKFCMSAKGKYGKEEREKTEKPELVSFAFAGERNRANYLKFLLLFGAQTVSGHRIFPESMTTSRRLADRKVERFDKNITKRGFVPETSTKKGNNYPVGPVLLGFFVFVVIGSSLFQIIRTATSGGMA